MNLVCISLDDQNYSRAIHKTMAIINNIQNNYIQWKTFPHSYVFWFTGTW